MSKVIDMTGKRFGRLVVKSRAGNDRNRFAMWNCVCDCGNKTVAIGSNIRSGHTKSCGCLLKEVAATKATKHGYSKPSDRHALYKTWQNIKTRCSNKNYHQYRDYGARGISICKEWRDDPAGFIIWCAKNGWEEGLQIDRIDNNKGYSPENCRFVTQTVNNQNKRLLQKPNTTKYCGVFFIGGKNPYRARVAFGKKQYHIGVFSVARVAAIARDFAVILAKAHHPLNFPELRNAIKQP